MKLNDNGYNITITDICPKCGKGIEPIHRNTSTYIDDDAYIVYLTLFCNICKESWVDSYLYNSRSRTSAPWSVNYYKEVPSDLPKDLAVLSPKGSKIYIQALSAEKDGYDTLVGIGLRKALEFFIKDYLILTQPDKESEIKTETLGKVIANHINDDVLQKLAKATSWIGNDETHYVRIHTDKDLEDLKRFLNATLRYFEYQLTIQDAQELLNRPKKS